MKISEGWMLVVNGTCYFLAAALRAFLDGSHARYIAGREARDAK